MFKFLILALVFYLLFRFIRGLFKGIFVITQIKRQQGESESNYQNPFIYRSNGKEKDISDRARILDEDKKEGETGKISDFRE
jgi:hypothetical protein